MLFERSKSDIDLEVMKNKYQELNLDRNLQFEQIKALKEKNAHLEEQNKLHITKYVSISSFNLLYLTKHIKS